jgi:selenide,water dikinase
VAASHEPTAHIAYPLLFDPQTAGGLLFGVPQARAQACLDELRETAAPDAAIVGNVTEPRGDAPIVVLG